MTDFFARFASVDEKTLDRWTKYGIVAVIVGLVLVGAVYYFDQNPITGPTLVERKMDTAEANVRKYPNSIAARGQLADLYRANGKPDKALEQYRAILEVQPGHRLALLGVAQVTAEQGKLDEAATTYRKIIAGSRRGEFSNVDPVLQGSYYGLGSILLKKGQARQATGMLQKAVRANSADADALYLLGTAQLKTGDPKSAVSSTKRALLFVPTGWCEPYEQLAVAYTQLRRTANAAYAVAMVDLCRKRPEDAERKLKLLVSGPAKVEALMGLGMIAEERADRKAAIRWYRKALAADPQNTPARQALNRLGVGKGAGSAPPGHSSTVETE